MLVENFSKFIKYYGEGRKFKLLCFLILSVIAGLFEFIGIALVYPFILLIISPQRVVHSKYYLEFARITHFNNVLANALLLGCVVACLFVLKNLFMVFIFYVQNKFLNSWKLDIIKKYIHYYLFSPYKNTLKTTPAEKIYNINFLISKTLDEFVFRIMFLTSNSIIVVMILSLLFIKLPFAAFSTTVFVIASLILQSKFFKKKMNDISQRFSKAAVINNEKTIESIGNIKEIKICSAEKYFYDDYVKSQKDYYNMLFENNFFGGLPTYIIEILIITALLVLAGLTSIQTYYDKYWMVASYAIIVACIFRIAPSLNKIQTSLNLINASRGFVKTMIAEYENSDFELQEKITDYPMEFKNCLKLQNISFAYRKTPVIKGLTLEIKKGEFVGIIGLSGAGKSTLADIIMGLLPVDSGQILLDESEINQDNFSAMRKLIGYVPQQINILDGSFKRNVAWGIEENKIDDEKVIEALKNAQLFDVVEEAGGINSNIISGATGLSQGQKQRLAIARALYKDPQILIFDEATSALDVETEHEITQMLNNLKGEKTIIAIAHRLSTLKSCSSLIYLKRGELIDTGSFDELSSRHADFEKLIKLSSLNRN